MYDHPRFYHTDLMDPQLKNSSNSSNGQANTSIKPWATNTIANKKSCKLCKQEYTGSHQCLNPGRYEDLQSIDRLQLFNHKSDISVQFLFSNATL